MFDFTGKFKDYSNVDLLKIVKRPGEYQIDAVSAAAEILSKRQVSNEEIQIVDHFFSELAETEKRKREKMEAIKFKTKDFFEPVLNPGKNIEPNKWLRILLLIIGIQYAWTLFETVKQLTSFFQCKNCEFGFSIGISILTVLYVPLIFLLLLKRNRWGWVLLFADTLFSFISGLSQSYVFFKYRDIHHGDTVSFILPILIRAAFVCFLWQDAISGFFGADKNIKTTTAMITAAGTLLFILIMFLSFS